MTIKSMAQLEADYIDYLAGCEGRDLHLKAWLPKLSILEALMPGDMTLLIGSTGSGKSACAQNIARAVAPAKVLIFSIELPGSSYYQRHIAMKEGFHQRHIREAYQDRHRTYMESLREKRQRPSLPPMVENHDNHVYVCTLSSLNGGLVSKILLEEAPQAIGETPSLVVFDYVQLMGGGAGKRYERMSDVAEGLKRLAKESNSHFLCVSQKARPNKDIENDMFTPVTVHDSKESGSWEASSQLVLGVWRDHANPALMYIGGLKNTNGPDGWVTKAKFSGATMRVGPWEEQGDIHAEATANKQNTGKETGDE